MTDTNQEVPKYTTWAHRRPLTNLLIRKLCCTFADKKFKM